MLNVSRRKKLDTLLTLIGLNIENYQLLNAALTHPSYVFEKGAHVGPHNQRLEFLGDAVVGLIVGDYLYNTFPDKSEGELTKMRAAVVCESSLARAAELLNIGDYILMGKGERLGGGAKRPSNLADAFESLVGALYLELGLDDIRDFTLKHIKSDLDRALTGNYGDYKTQFQELVQKKPDVSVEYKILSESGPDHEKEFLSGVFLNGSMLAQGKGRTKKEAEQLAAQEALSKMGELTNE